MASQAARGLLAGTTLAPTASMPGFLFRDSLPSGFIPSGVVSGDFNGDGKMDFVVCNGGDDTLWVYLGRGDGSFNLPTIVPITQGESPVAMAAGHLRGTNILDIVVAEADSHTIGIFLGNGSGGFTESTISLPYVPGSIVLGDFNNDGKTDVVVGFNDQDGKSTLAMLPGAGNGSFGAAVMTPNFQYAPYIFWLTAGDLNGDGKTDLIVSSAFAYISIQVYLGKGDGTFTRDQIVSESFGSFQELSTVIFDGDEDGKLDVGVADSFGGVSFFHGNGDGTFSTTPGMFGTGDVPYGIAAADINGDGHLDLITSGIFIDAGLYGAAAGNLTSVLLGDGTGNFSRARVYRGDVSAFSMAVADFNGDGHPDVVTANQDSDSAVLFLNDGSGGFGDPQGSWIGFPEGGAVNAPLSGLVSSDINGDGFPDLALIEWPPNGSQFFQLAVMLNDGHGHFSDPIPSDAIDSTLSSNFGDFVLADFRKSGHKDFLAVGFDASYGLPSYLAFSAGSGNGDFGPLSTVQVDGAQGTLGVGDFDGNGTLDFVAVSGFLSSTNFLVANVFSGNGDGTFRKTNSQQFGGPPAQMGLGTATAVYVDDFNRDGHLDLLVFSRDTGNVYELLGAGNGSFQAARNLSTSQFWPLTAVDLNRDGHADLALYQSTLVPDGREPWRFSANLGQPNGSFLSGNSYAPYSGKFVAPQARYATSAAAHFAPMVADFNGDGNLDIAIFQQSASLVAPTVFAQFLLGNGDGTFTPSFTSFDFKKSTFPNLAIDADGDGLADLIELDGYRSSFHVIRAVPGPAFTIELVTDPVPASTGEGLVTLGVVSASATVVTLSASDPAIHVPASITVPAGQPSQTFSFTIAAGFNRNHVFALSGQLGTQIQTAFGTQAGAAKVGFSTQVGGIYTLPDLSLAAGQDAQVLVNVYSLGGYSSDLNLECVGLPAAATCIFSPPSVHLAAGDSSIVDLKVSTGSTSPQGIHPVKVRASDVALTYDSPFSLDIGDFSMKFTPDVIHLFPDQQTTTLVVLSSLFKYNRPVGLSCNASSTVECAIPPFSVPYPTGETFSVGIRTQSTPPGTYQVGVTGTDAPLSHSASAKLEVWDFKPSLEQTSATIKAGSSSDFKINVASVNGFAGDLLLSCTIPGADLSCTLNPATITVSAGGTSTSTLTVGAKASSSARDMKNAFPLLAMYTLLMPGLMLWMKGFPKKWWKLYGIFFLLICAVSCGGGGVSTGGAGGGGGGSNGGGGSTGGGGSNGLTVTVYAAATDPQVSYSKKVEISINVN